MKSVNKHGMQTATSVDRDRGKREELQVQKNRHMSGWKAKLAVRQSDRFDGALICILLI